MRTANRVVTAVIGLALLVGGVLTAAEIATAFVGRGQWIVPYTNWYRDARANDWQNGGVRGLFVLIGAVGLVLLIMQLVRRRPLTIALRSSTKASYVIRRRSLEQSLTRSVQHVDGVESAAVRIDRRSVRVSARSHRRLPGDVETAIHEAVDGRLNRLELNDPLATRIRLRLRREAS
jgi:hypothetical protein